MNIGMVTSRLLPILVVYTVCATFMVASTLVRYVLCHLSLSLAYSPTSPNFVLRFGAVL